MTHNFISSMPLNSAFWKESKNVKNVNFAKAVVEKAQLAKHAQKIFLTYICAIKRIYKNHFFQKMILLNFSFTAK